MPTQPIPPKDPIHRADRLALRGTAGVALAVTVLALVVAAASALLPLLTDDGLSIDLLLEAGASVGTATEGASGIRSIIPESAVVTLDTAVLSNGALVLLLLERALIGLIVAVVSAAIGYTLMRIARGEAFHRSLFAVTATVGAVLSIGMMLAVGLGGIGRMMAAFELNELLGGQPFTPGFTADPTVVFVGIAVVGLAYVFRIGERLQHDTKGLV